jgi:PKD repeat protein
MRSMMSVTAGGLTHGLIAALVVVGLVFLISGSSARADTIVSGGLKPNGVAVDRAGTCSSRLPTTTGGVEHAAAAPTAGFTGAQNAGSLTVAFTDASTAASPATISGWSWSFGDSSPSSNAEDPSHTYATPGSFTVSLTVTDSNGKTSTISHQVTAVQAYASLTYPTTGQTKVDTATPFSWADIPTGRATSYGSAPPAATGACCNPGRCRRPPRPVRCRRSRPA